MNQGVVHGLSVLEVRKTARDSEYLGHAIALFRIEPEFLRPYHRFQRLRLFASYKSQAEGFGVMSLLDSYCASAGTDTITGRSSALTRTNCDVPARTAAAQADMPFTC